MPTPESPELRRKDSPKGSVLKRAKPSVVPTAKQPASWLKERWRMEGDCMGLRSWASASEVWESTTSDHDGEEQEETMRGELTDVQV